MCGIIGAVKQFGILPIMQLVPGSLLYPWLFLLYPWLTLLYSWLSLPILTLSLAVPGVPCCPGLSLPCHGFLTFPPLDKRNMLPHFAVLVGPWLNQELNSGYQGSREDWCWLPWLQCLYKCDLFLQRWQNHGDLQMKAGKGDTTCLLVIAGKVSVKTFVQVPVKGIKCESPG